MNRRDRLIDNNYGISIVIVDPPGKAELTFNPNKSILTDRKIHIFYG